MTLLLATVLNIDSQMAYNGVVLLISAAGFVIMYNKTIKNRVDKGDIVDLKKYVDQQDRSLHHRINNVERHYEEHIKELRETTNKILEILIHMRNKD